MWTTDREDYTYYTCYSGDIVNNHTHNPEATIGWLVQVAESLPPLRPGCKDLLWAATRDTWAFSRWIPKRRRGDSGDSGDSKLTVRTAINICDICDICDLCKERCMVNLHGYYMANINYYI